MGFRIRRVYDAVIPVDRDVVGQVPGYVDLVGDEHVAEPEALLQVEQQVDQQRLDDEVYY